MRVRLVIAGLLLLGTGTVAAESARPLDRLRFAVEPQPASELALKDESGASLDLSAFRGRTVVLNLWAVWCLPCRKEMPALNRLAKAVADLPVAVVPVAIDRRGPTPVRAFLDSVGAGSLPVLLANGPGVVDAFNFAGLPFTVLLDEEGREFGRLIGAADWDDPAFVAFLRDRIGQTRSAERKRQ